MTPDERIAKGVIGGKLSKEELASYAKEGRCFWCHSPGHLKKDCPKKDTKPTTASGSGSTPSANVLAPSPQAPKSNARRIPSFSVMAMCMVIALWSSLTQVACMTWSTNPWWIERVCLLKPLHPFGLLALAQAWIPTSLKNARMFPSLFSERLSHDVFSSLNYLVVIFYSALSGLGITAQSWTGILPLSPSFERMPCPP